MSLDEEVSNAVNLQETDDEEEHFLLSSHFERGREDVVRLYVLKCTQVTTKLK